VGAAAVCLSGSAHHVAVVEHITKLAFCVVRHTLGKNGRKARGKTPEIVSLDG
jgi:enhancing lycopene biosynthesis protein 2